MIKTIITIIFCSVALCAKTNSTNDVELVFKENPTQKNIDKTYRTGLIYLSHMLVTLKKAKSLKKEDLYTECNEQFYSAIFKGTVVEKAQIKDGAKTFIKDCKEIVNRISVND